MVKIGGVKYMKKKNWGIRILCLFIFLGLSSIVALSIYKLSAEDGVVSNNRSETVTEAIKQEVNTKLNERGLALADKVKYFVILHSPYGSDWNGNIRKLAHFSIYFALACMVYISFAILGVKKMLRFILTIAICFCFALADEYHQRLTGRTSMLSDVYLDTFGAFCATSGLTVLAWIISGIRYGVNKTCGISESEN